jgi:hypothetical protein
MNQFKISFIVRGNSDHFPVGKEPVWSLKQRCNTKIQVVRDVVPRWLVARQLLCFGGTTVAHPGRLESSSTLL